MILKYIFMYYLTFLKDDDSEHEDMDEDEIEEEEVKDTFFNSGILYCNLQCLAEVVGEKDALLINSSKVLRDGKMVSNGQEDMDNLAGKIKELMQHSLVDHQLE